MDEQPPLSVTKKYITSIIQYFLKHPLDKGTFLNVNFPYHAKKKIAGFRMAKQGKSYWRESPDRRIHPEGAPYFWLGGTWWATEEDPQSDVALLDQSFVTAVPIQVGELTCFKTLKQHEQLTEKHLF